MEENSLKKEKDLEFANIGEYETIKKQQKIRDKEIIEPPEEKPIHFDGRQYSCKIPKKIMDSLGYKRGDCLKFVLIKIPSEEKVMVKIEYVRK